jgi:hypothetical protein
MKRVLFSVLVFILLAASLMLLFVGCSATKDVQIAQDFIDDYFDNLDDEDYDDLLDMFDDELLDDLGGEEATLDTLTLRRKSAGDIDEYEIEATEFEHKEGKTLVTFEVETTYEREKNVDEKFSILVDGKDISLVIIELDALTLHNKMLDRFTNAYKNNDLSKIAKLILPIYFDYSTEQDIQNMVSFTSSNAGNFEGYSVLNEQRLLSDIDDKAFALFEVNLLMEHNDIDMIARLQFCEQDNEFGISFIELTPAPCKNVSDAYFSAIQEGNIHKVMSLYNLEVFENMEGGASDWQEYLSNIFNQAGELQQYTTTRWYMDEAMLKSGLNEKIIVVVNQATYSNGAIEDKIGISYKNGINEILYHQITPIE